MLLITRIKLIFKLLFISIITTLISCSNELAQSDLYVAAVKNPKIKLNGTWKLSLNPSAEFWIDNNIDNNWKDIEVPGEVMMQGFSIKNDIPFVYKKEIEVPLDYEGNDIILQFDGVYSYSRVWVNGNYVRDHHGGFTRWKCDITPFVKAGAKAWVTVEVTDRADDISYGSGYAKHQIGGILRDVKLLALPKNYPEIIQIETDLDAQYKDANLIVSGNLKDKGENSKVVIQLFDNLEKEITLQESAFTFKGEDSFQIKNTIADPKKWDAEHPNLYTLQVLYLVNDKVIWSKKKKIGFREIEIANNTMLVNGKSVKLRGACRHDIHPTLGRVSTPEYELKDVLLTKESNMNFIRTSHYPPTENFLSLCDEYGIYVEDETAVCFVIDYRIKGYEAGAHSQSDPAYTTRYLSQLEELVTNHRNHPSVVIWSIGNENVFGDNFEKSYKWLKQNDTTRPVMFSYPGTAEDSIMPYEILSMHYPGYSGDMNQYDKETVGFGFKDMPVIFDEWAHVACYNNETIIEDPNIRDFWGQSLDKMWSKTFDSDGGLGGAIWGMIDETFMLPKDLDGFRDWWGINDNTVLPYRGTTIGYGEWGIIDVWRRKKPEFWNTKKAYSPIKITATTIANYKEGTEIEIPVYNRFDHTNLNEIKIQYTYKGKSEYLKSFDLEPHQKGSFNLPISSWDTKEKITINFYDSTNNLIDSYKIQQAFDKGNSSKISDPKISEITLIDENSTLKISTSIGEIIIDKSTGLIVRVQKGDHKFALKGPYMVYKTKGKRKTYSTNFIHNYAQNWKLKSISHTIIENKLIVRSVGEYDKIKVLFELTISPDGKITTSYSYKNLPEEYVREVGVRYSFDPVFDALSWERDTYWSAYPKNYMSAPKGKVPLYAKALNSYRKEPVKPWNQDSKSFYYEGTDDEILNQLTLVAKASKENVFEYALIKGDTKLVKVVSNGDVSCRLEQNEGRFNLYLNSKTDYVDLSWGNYQRNIVLESHYTGEINFSIIPNINN